jgi:hypothetical protein
MWSLQMVRLLVAAIADRMSISIYYSFCDKKWERRTLLKMSPVLHEQTDGTLWMHV